jgi:hypothetical protein
MAEAAEFERRWRSARGLEAHKQAISSTKQLKHETKHSHFFRMITVPAYFSSRTGIQ